MDKQEQVLILEPAGELHFVGPFTDVVTSYLKLMNPLDRRVCFKVKTTAPKKYCVRPNSGVLEPKQVVNVAVMLQPFDYNPNEKNKHKFMVQTMIVPDGDVNIEHLWRDAKSDSLMDSKLRCVFDMPTERTVQNNNLDTSEVSGDDKTIVNKVVAEPGEKYFSKAALKGIVDPELKKMADENKRLRDEIQLIKQENSQLKADGLRGRYDAGTEVGGVHLRSRDKNPRSLDDRLQEHTKPFDDRHQEHPRPFDDRLQEQPQSPMLYLAVMLTIGLLGIFLGKFVV